MNEKEINLKIKNEIESSKVLLFMKGTPIFPQCGFSSTVIQILTSLGAKFNTVDVLKDQDIRQGIKEYSDWPTIPQLYINGEFIGGCDIITEMYESGELSKLMVDQGIELQTE
ncbi:Grx4 family monothiol glutaredoxin [Alphaproteobacteria bacterium]|nr:Grx4 family monothiol glutaredoxin [Alphaproteobacteria bacterium]